MATQMSMTRAIAPRSRALSLAPRSNVLKSRVVVVPRAQNDIDTDAIVNDLQEKWEAVENKPAAIIYATGALAGVWVANSVVGAINALPLLPKVFELVGLGYSAWFTYRYLLFKSNREELAADIEELKSKITS